MTYIYPITDPKILKLGIRMALYGEKKPEIITRKSFGKEINKINEDWHKSWFIAYLKEPEFKEGEIIIEIATQKKMEVGVVCGDGSFAAAYIEKNKSYTRTNKSFSQDSTLISHYYPGQEVESFKYVKLIKYSQINPSFPTSATQRTERAKWKEVEEPEEDKYFILGGDKVQAMDMEKPIVDEYDFKRAYTQFQEGKKQAIILAEITVPTK